MVNARVRDVAAQSDLPEASTDPRNLSRRAQAATVICVTGIRLLTQTVLEQAVAEDCSPVVSTTEPYEVARA